MSAQLRRTLAEKFRTLREAAGFATHEAVAAVAEDLSRATVSRSEDPRQGVAPRSAKELLHVYGVKEPERSELLEMVRASRQKDQWLVSSGATAHYAEHVIAGEAAAKLIQVYQNELIPSSFQTEAYAREIMLASTASPSTERIERNIELRMARQKRLFAPSGPAISAVISEAVIRHLVDGMPELAGEQIEKLMSLSARRSVELRVLPFAAGAHPGMTGPYVIQRFPQGEPTIYFESYRSSTYPNDRTTIDLMTWVHDKLTAKALSPRETRDLLRTLAGK